MDEQMSSGLEAFAEALASSSPTPGGGGAAALAGALAASLCAMAARLTAGRKKYADRAERLQRIIARSDELRVRLLQLIGEDAKGFAPLAAAYSLPKDDPEANAVLRDATLRACEAPMEMLRCAAAAVELLEEAYVLASPLLLSDVGCGASLARAALECAAMNVLVNTRSLPDDLIAVSLQAEVRRILDAYIPRSEAVAASVAERLVTP
jgi:formiminotetrahydrofolate cyclodeaminase